MFITGVGKEVIDLCKNFINSNQIVFSLCTGHAILTSNFILEQSDGVNFQTYNHEFSNIDLEASIYACLFFKALIAIIYQKNYLYFVMRYIFILIITSSLFSYIINRL
jgi:putative intracellular protease/amidase